jgi:hypothetical protein|tara:strand:+ start:12401 stop:12592 length:192 start_codon:yes stop_codon:yes gene_type:complete
MAPIWPFRKKSIDSAKALKVEKNKVVEYEREIRTDNDKKSDRSHLTNKNFIDAMAIFSDDKTE